MTRAISFGTDGIRGPAGVFPLDDSGARRIGRAVAAWAGPGQPIIVGRDTRHSGPALSRAVGQGLVDGGCVVLDGGVMPTPAVSCAVASHQAAGGLVITASHNPWRDNGVKVLAQGGGKLIDPQGVERWLDDPPCPGGGHLSTLDDPLGPWLSALPRLDLSGLRLLVDCAHGAAWRCAPAYLRELGATVVERGCQPDGRNINDGVGALHPPTDLDGCDLGIVLDGDADRLMLIDPVHGALDGDDLLWLLAGADVEGGTVVGTVMTNAGLEDALGGRLLRTPVGDRFVAQAMARTGARIGGEPSGHLIIAGGPPTSCGLTTALTVLARSAQGDQGRPVLPLPVGGWTRWPQVSTSVPSTRDLQALRTVPQARASGLRVIVRYSGTEPVVRVMVEGRQAELARTWADRISAELTAPD